MMGALRESLLLTLVVGIYTRDINSPRDFWRDRYKKQPNIIYIMADDLGWNDVGFHNDKVVTPHIDKLHSDGIELTQSYTQPICSPSRSAFVTGKYPTNNGLGLFVIFDNSRTCLPIEHKTIFEYMKDEGYVNYYIGKWHLGHCNETCMPTSRGVDEFRGVLAGDADYFDWTNTGLFSRWRNNEPNNDNVGTHITIQDGNDVEELIQNHNCSKNPFFMWLTVTTPHAPLQVTDEMFNVHGFLDANDTDQRKRRQFLGLVSALDDLVGRTRDALEAAELDHNTIIVFSSDNGGEATPTIFPGFDAYGNNYPLRNGKYAFTEGGVKTPCIYYDPRLHKRTRGTKRDFLVHLTDWLPTFVHLAQKGFKSSSFAIPDIDGVSQLANLGSSYSKRKGRRYNRREDMLVALTSFDTSKLFCGNDDAAFRWQDYKLIYGNRYYLTDPDTTPSEWVMPLECPGCAAITGDTCKVTIGDKTVMRCLFNVVDDPSETSNLYNDEPELVAMMLNKIQEYKEMSKRPTFNPSLGVSNVTAEMWDGELIPRTDFCDAEIHSPLLPIDPSCY